MNTQHSDAQVTTVGRPAVPVACLVLAALTGVALVLYAPVLRELTMIWRDVPYYSYGFLLPVFSAYLVWESRKTLIEAPLTWWLPGTAVIAAGLLLLLAGSLTASLTIKTLSLPIVLAGIGMLVLGLERFKTIAFAIAFLGLMTPLPSGTLQAISLPLQELASAFTAAALTILRIPHVHAGLYIHLQPVTLHVEEACNGLRFLLAMVVVGVAFAALTQKGWARRLAVFVLAVAVGIVANLFRVAGTAVLANGWGPEAATGFFHMTYGKVVYGIMMIPFVAGVLWLRRSAREPQAE